MVINHILEISGEINQPRTPLTVLTKVVEEVGELSTEIAIDKGICLKEPSSDGVVGEAVDAIIALVDIIKLHKPDITESEILKVATSKCNKWYSKCHNKF